MIKEFRHPLVPAWVAAGKFPDGDEDRLRRLGDRWGDVAEQATSAESQAAKQSALLFGAWSGEAATSASSQVMAVQKWIVSIGSTATVMGNGCGTAAGYLVHAKTAINNILRALANTTTRSILAALVNPLDAPRLATEVSQAQAWARAQITQYYSALGSMLGSLPFQSEIQPDVRAAVTGAATGAGSAAGGTVKVAVRATTTRDNVPIQESDIAEVRPDQTIVLKNGTVVPPVLRDEAPTTQAAGGTPGAAGTVDTAGAPSVAATAGALTLPWGTGLVPVRNPGSIAGEEQIGGDKNDKAVEEATSKLEQESHAVPAGLDDSIQRGDVVTGPTQEQTQQIRDDIASGGGTAQSGHEGVSSAQQQVDDGRQQAGSGNAPGQPTTPQDAGGGQGGGGDQGADQGGHGGGTHGGWGGDQGGTTPEGGGASGGSGDIPGAGGEGSSSGAGSTGTFGGSGADTSGGTSTGTGGSGGSTTGGGGAGGGGAGGGGQSGGGTPSSGQPGGPAGDGTGGLSSLASQGTGAAGVSAPVAPIPVAGMPPGMPPGMPGGVAGAPMGGSYGSTPLLGGSGFGGPAAPSVGVGGLGAPAPAPAPLSAPMAGGGIPAAPSTGGAVAPPSMPAASAAAPPSMAPNPAVAPAPLANQPGIGPNQQGQPAAGGGSGAGGAGAGTSPGARGDAGAGVPETAITVAAAIASLGLAGAAAMHFSHLWTDLRANPIVQPSGAAVLPTQFGPSDQETALLPAGLSAAYQKVLLPGEADALLDGQVTTLRGLVHPLDQVAHLATPADLYAALGLGFAVMGHAGADSLAFNRDATSIDVLRFAGIRPEDLITPVEADVVLPPDTVPLPLVRRHARPWTGTGEAPGSTSSDPIDEHEILGYAAVSLPHLAEIWRLHADGSAEYVSTYNARNASWVGSTAPARQATDRFDNGAFATLADGNVFEIVPLSDQYAVLIARGPVVDGFQPAQDGTSRIQVANEHVVALTGVTTIGSWQGLPVQLLERSGGSVLVDYAGDDAAAAAAAGFLQVNQGQWQPRWVAQQEVGGVQRLERPYPLPAHRDRSAARPTVPVAPPPRPVELDDDRLGV